MVLVELLKDAVLLALAVFLALEAWAIRRERKRIERDRDRGGRS